LETLRSDDLLLSDDAGWGGFPDGRPRQTASRALLPRFAETAEPAPIAAARQLPGSYADSLTSPVQPSPQGPYDTHWLRCNGDVRHAATDAPLSVCTPSCGFVLLWTHGAIQTKN
jgi:hypothetical protein